MKKRISAELISIAHRILKLKNHSETRELQQEAKNLYDQLTILRFYEENFEWVKNEISQEVLEEKLEAKPTEVFNVPLDVVVENNKVENEIEIASQVFEVPIEAEKVIIAELPVEEDEEEIQPDVEANENEIKIKTPSKPESVVIGTQATQISFEDMLVHDYAELDFVKVEDVPVEVENALGTIFEAVEPVTEEFNAEILSELEEDEVEIPVEEEVKITFKKAQKEDKTSSLNDKLNKTISFGLNDRIGFEKKLFGGSSDDFNRVISQLNTFDSFDEARSFVQDFVKPDYNNWDGNEEFEARFMEIVEKKFN
mgnify:CR=1 FL=1|jgi:hypothetical protein